MSNSFLYYLSELAKGLPATLSLGVLGILSAGILAIFLSCLLTLNKKYLSSIINGYITIFTGSPLLVQLFLIYYGPTQFTTLHEYLPNLFSSPWFCAYITLTLNSAAYTTQIFYGALKVVPIGLSQACVALGMNRIQTLKIILLYGLKRALSTYSNEVVFVIKGTALASTIPVMEIMRCSKDLMEITPDFTIFIAVGLIYLLINGLLSALMRLLEWRALRFERQ